MILRSLLIGAAFGLGLWLLIRGGFPSPVPLADRLSRFAESGPSPTVKSRNAGSARGRIAVWFLQVAAGENIGAVEADVAVTGLTLESHARNKLDAAAAGAVLLPAMCFLFGLVGNVFAVSVTAMVGFIAAFHLPDLELKRKAAARRAEFVAALNAFVNLVAISIAGGSGIQAAMVDTISIGEGWSFGLLGAVFDDADLRGDSPWTALDNLGTELSIAPLIELGGALSLAGSSGARINETLQARAESGRAKALSEAVAEAGKRSESMNVPVAMMLLGWMGFMGYPAVAGLIGT